MTRWSRVVVGGAVAATLTMVAGAYWYTHGVLTSADRHFTATESNVTLNLVLLYFFWGLLSDRIGKGRGKRFGWVVFLAGLVAITLVMRFAGGMRTVIG